ncbi:MAG TPA: universal stress protein [Vicinamibacterales bacterium]|nr:universal stress protein [Vicinamibacterales bacterium]
MVTIGNVREILLHGSSDESFDSSVGMARRLAESFGAHLHVVYTIDEPLSAGWTAEISAEKLPELHQAMEAEARERLAGLIPLEDQDRLGVQIALRTGTESEELVRYTDEHAIDLAIVQARPSDSERADVAQALIDRGKCAVLVLR